MNFFSKENMATGQYSTSHLLRGTELMLVVDSEELNAQLRTKMQEYEEDALKVIDVDTSIAPEGKAAQEVSDGKNRLLQILKYFNWGRFIM